MFNGPATPHHRWIIFQPSWHRIASLRLQFYVLSALPGAPYPSHIASALRRTSSPRTNNSAEACHLPPKNAAGSVTVPQGIDTRPMQQGRWSPAYQIGLRLCCRRSGVSVRRWWCQPAHRQGFPDRCNSLGRLPPLATPPRFLHTPSSPYCSAAHDHCQRHLVGNDQMVFIVGRCLDVVTNRPGALVARGHWACIWIGKKGLLVWTLVELHLHFLEYLHLLFQCFYLFFKPLCFGFSHFGRSPICRIHCRQISIDALFSLLHAYLPEGLAGLSCHSRINRALSQELLGETAHFWFP